MTETVVRIAARGEGVTDRGRYFALTAPGDVVLDDGAILPGPGRQAPPCRHFPECGGCQLQHLTEAAYRDYLLSRVEGALAQHGLAAEIVEPHLSPPNSRRRATLHAVRTASGVALGLKAARSNRVVDMTENYILRPELLALLPPLRNLMAAMLPPRGSGQAQMTLVDQGVDLLLTGIEPRGLAAIETLGDFASGNLLARLGIDSGLGPEILFEPEPATITLAGRPVPFPTGAFLQATEDGEAALVAAVRQAVGGAAATADLFAGLGTFALALDGKIYAAEAARDLVLALKLAAPAIAAEHRDLYRRPLDTDELGRFDAVVLDPPRAGAAEQIAKLAASSVPRIAYVSCNPATFARDARTLTDGSYRLDWVKPVGQFRWSTHVELAAAFAR